MHEHDERCGGAGPIVLSFFVGGIVGAGLALLFAPQSGSETRQQIKELADNAKERAAGCIGQTKTYVKTAIDAGKEAYEKEKERYKQELASKIASS